MVQLYCQAIIFDLDGVLVDSSAVIERSWRRWAGEHDLNPEDVLRVTPGRRMVEVVRLLAPHLDAEEEARRLAAREGPDTQGLVRVDGATALLRSLPERRWAVATSGTQITATTRLRYAGLPAPHVLVTADDVTHGKPDPEVYLLAAQGLDVAAEQCLVVEDAPAGIEAARAAGMFVIALPTTHPPQALTGADVVARQLADIQIEVDGLPVAGAREMPGARLQVTVP